MKSLVETLQPLGRALMLPIAVLPAAGLLLRFGQPDLCNIPFIAAAGDAIFSHLGLLFAIGVAFGLAKENHGAAGLAGAVCFLVATVGAKTLIVVPPESLQGFSGAARSFAESAFREAALAKLGIPAGIISGLVSGALYNRFHEIKLPDCLAFFGGRRFVPIAAGCAGILLAAILGYGWTTINAGMDSFSHAISRAGALGLFVYGTANRLLLVTGLHHILNNLVWFMLGDFHGVTGDIKRFFAGDPTAGAFMTGFFPVMMFGLPAACLAMYHTVPKARRPEASGLFLSMALTAFLTGVTEPIEFSFMFLAPGLYAVHAVLTGTSMALMNFLGIKLGFGFSAGLVDYLINFGKATHPLMLLPVGAAFGVIYYAIFRFAIHKFDLKTPGREEMQPTTSSASAAAGIVPTDRGAAFVAALGGADNLVNIDACTTRLRLVVKNGKAVDEATLKTLGTRGIVRPSPDDLQVVLGPIADQVAGEIRECLTAGIDDAAVRRLLAALGGRQNVQSIASRAGRVVVTLREPASSNAAALKDLVPRGVVVLPGSVQLLFGPQSAVAAERLLAAGER